MFGGIPRPPTLSELSRMLHGVRFPNVAWRSLASFRMRNEIASVALMRRQIDQKVFNSVKVDQCNLSRRDHQCLDMDMVRRVECPGRVVAP